MRSSSPRGGSSALAMQGLSAAAASKGPNATAAVEVKAPPPLPAQINRLVCCKSDGARFLAGDTTIKLRCGESYSFTLSVTPGLELASKTAELRYRQAEVPEPGLLLCCLPTSGGGAAGRRLHKTLARSASAKAALHVAAKYDDLNQLEWQEPVRLAISERASSRGGGAASSIGGGATAVKTMLDAHWAGCALPPTRAGRRCELALELELGGYGRVVLPLVTKVYGAKEAAAARHGVTCNSVVYTLARSSITGEVKVVAVHYAK